MKKYFLYALMLCAFIGCKDNSGLYGLLADMDNRIAEVEQQCEQINTNIDALEALVEAQQTGDYITAIIPIKEGDVEIGYSITFAKHDPITIYHGKNGKDGQDGQNGTNGTNGTNGQDGHSPVIGVAQDTDGVYYWTLDGEWMLDGNGQKLRVTGQDGQDGQDGTDGTNGITPQLKIEADYWYISYDGGTTWTQLGKAKGDDGADGQDGDSMFQSVTQDDLHVYFTLTNGTTIVIVKANSDINDFEQTIKDNLVTTLTLDTNLLYVYVGESDSLHASTLPFSDSSVRWKSSNANIVSVDGGAIEAISGGVVTITAEAGDKTATCTVVSMDENLQNQISASASKHIQFSPGNLLVHVYYSGLYNMDTNIDFTFQTNQYAYLGGETQGYVSGGFYMDLFGWGTSGKSTGYSLDVWSTSSSNNIYPSGSIANTQYDWGVYNAIGSDPAGTWRTPTKDEFSYILNNRACKTYLYTCATVCGVKGLLILSDGGIPRGIPYIKTTDFSTNIYTSVQWAVLEASGAVFLPNAGRRDSGSSTYTGISSLGSMGYYWTTEEATSSKAYNISTKGVIGSCDKAYGCSVRLVKDVE